MVAGCAGLKISPLPKSGSPRMVKRHVMRKVPGEARSFCLRVTSVDGSQAGGRDVTYQRISRTQATRCGNDIRDLLI